MSSMSLCRLGYRRLSEVMESNVEFLKSREGGQCEGRGSDTLTLCTLLRGRDPLRRHSDSGVRQGSHWYTHLTFRLSPCARWQTGMLSVHFSCRKHYISWKQGRRAVHYINPQTKTDRSERKVLWKLRLKGSSRITDFFFFSRVLKKNTEEGDIHFLWLEPFQKRSIKILQ